MGSLPGKDNTNEGERCSIVTRAALRASAGTSVTAVAPLPMTMTRRPAMSRSSGHSCGWTTWPVNVSRPGQVGV